MNHFDVILVSSFGQLEALACELGRSGLNTLIIDVTDRLGLWPLEDREGPFGEIFSDSVMGAWQEISSLGDLPVACEMGQVIWTSSMGPVALRGPLIQHQMKTRGWKNSQSPISQMNDFNSQWLAWLSRSFYDTRFHSWDPELLKTPKVEIENSLSIRFPTRSGLTARREWLKSQGVQVWVDADILDVMDVYSGLEVRGPVSGVIKTQSLVWGLTSYETDHMSFRVREKIFGSEVNKPDWAWIRYRLSVDNPELTQGWPHHMLMIENPALPLTHSDLIVMQRTVLNNQFDAWIRIPDSKRFHQAYLQRMKDEIKNKIQTRLPKLKFEFIFEPQELSYTSKELGPRPSSQYNEKLRLRKTNHKNLFFDGPEVWPHFSNLSLFQNQKRILDQILIDWRKKQNQNQSLKNQERHP